jgi:uncharacterized protein YfcZ (UPF0381/DUF406 family)
MRFLTMLLVLTLAAAHDKKGAAKHTHSKTQKAHDHGAAEINIAVEGKTAQVEIHAPAMGVVGFEYIPTTAADKKKQADALAKLKANAASIVMFDAAAGCKVSAANAKVEQEEADHAEVDADFNFACAQPLAGTKISFGMTKAYPAFASVKVQVIGASGQAGAEIKSDKGFVAVPK